MKRIIFILAWILIYTGSWAQSQFPSENIRPVWNAQEKVSGLFWIATTDTIDYPASNYPGAISYRSDDSSLYVSDGHGWHPIASGLTAVTGVTNNKDSLFVTNSDGNTDTLILNFYTKDSLYTKYQVDSVAAKRASDTTFSNIKIDTVKTISQLENYNGSAKILLVTDSLRGGLFYKKTGTMKVDSGIIFSSFDNKYWIRQHNYGDYYAGWYGIVGDSLTDNTVAIRRMFNSIPLKGGHIYFPPGNFIVSDTILVASKCIVTGSGGQGWDHRAVPHYTIDRPSTQIIQASDKNLFVVTANDTRFEHIGLTTFNTSTIGSGIKFIAGYNIRVDDISISGFNILLDILTGNKYMITNSDFTHANKYMIQLADTIHKDAGDGVISNCTFYSDSVQNTTVIKYLSGGGLKITDCKFNTYDIYMAAPHYIIDADLIDNTATSDFIMSDCSLEGFDSTAIYFHSEPGSRYGSIQINNNQFAPYWGTISHFINLDFGDTLSQRSIISNNIFDPRVVAGDPKISLKKGVININNSSFVKIANNNFGQIETDSVITISNCNHVQIIQDSINSRALYSSYISADSLTIVGNSNSRTTGIGIGTSGNTIYMGNTNPVNGDLSLAVNVKHSGTDFWSQENQFGSSSLLSLDNNGGLIKIYNAPSHHPPGGFISFWGTSSDTLATLNNLRNNLAYYFDSTQVNLKLSKVNTRIDSIIGSSPVIPTLDQVLNAGYTSSIGIVVGDVQALSLSVLDDGSGSYSNATKLGTNAVGTIIPIDDPHSVTIVGDSNYTVTDSDKYIILSNPTVERTLTLPTSSAEGRELTIVCKSSGTDKWKTDATGYVPSGNFGTPPYSPEQVVFESTKVYRIVWDNDSSTWFQINN